MGQQVIFRARLHNMRPQGELLPSRALYELIYRCQDRVPDLPTASPHSPGCPCRLGREGRAPGVQADAQVRPDHPGELVSIIQVITANRQSESLVTVEGVIKEADVKSCTIQSYEIGIQKLYTAVEVGELPFSLDDASRPESDFVRVSDGEPSAQDPADLQMETEDVQFSRVSLPTRLDNRILDLRVSC